VDAEQRIAQSPAHRHPPDTAPEDVERLLDAARAALAWFYRFDEHAPEGLAFGGEAKVRRQLRQAIRLAAR